MPRAGKYRHRITIEQDVGSDDPAGQRVTNWSGFAVDVPAEVVALSGGETSRSGQTTATATHKVTMRWQSGITPQMRIVHEGQTLGIIKVDDVEGKRKELTIECKAEV